MNPFDQAWAFLKAPVHETGIPGIRFVTQGEDDPDWDKDPNVYGGDMGGVEKWGRHIPEAENDRDLHEVKHMTPSKFLSLTPSGGMDDSSEYYRDLFERAQAGEDIKFVMPHVFIGDQDPDDPDFDRENFHDGRHRMQELDRMGLGDVSVPVHYTQL
jgi:hypothetical protein